VVLAVKKYSKINFIIKCRPKVHSLFVFKKTWEFWDGIKTIQYAQIKKKSHEKLKSK
jgi:hypothetical protein